MFGIFSKYIKVPESSDNNIKMKIELLPDNNVGIKCYWPKPKDDEDRTNIVKSYATLVCATLSRDMLPLIQVGVTEFGTNYNDMETARGILGLLHYFLQQQQQLNNDNSPVVSPIEAFKVK